MWHNGNDKHANAYGYTHILWYSNDIFVMVMPYQYRHMIKDIKPLRKNVSHVSYKVTFQECEEPTLPNMDAGSCP